MFCLQPPRHISTLPICMDRPRVASRKWWFGEVGLALLYPAYWWSLWAPGHHGYPRAFDLIRDSAPKARRATWSRTRWRDLFSISTFRLADLGGKANSCFRDQLEPSAIPLV